MREKNFISEKFRIQLMIRGFGGFVQVAKSQPTNSAEITIGFVSYSDFRFNLIASENINGDSRLKPKNSTKTLSRGIPTTYW